jgi:hypothetical protein
MTDTTTTAPDVVHLVEVVRHGLRLRAECGCGWQSEWCGSPPAAGEAGTEHRDTAVGVPDEMDGLMSRMLDLQDDLAEMVVWLAENWSADLPVPVLYGTGGGISRAGVQLSVCCTDRDDLIRVAHLLGAPVADKSHSNPVNGLRYIYTDRDFGRVHVEAFTAVGRDVRR